MAGASGPDCHRVTNAVTTNMLRVFMNGPAGHQHPAIDNLAALGGYHGTAHLPAD
jgi:hypothetical protein